ncbi:hypothetical protein MLD38_005390 [Melastoma candidum]|uniref:Uncharacterized protein n=1 Tax=Melastoma candidum TaxID=119954 RepID=A0ACB9S7W2_9MYRT|nr:hypothetical protein MLD38_005390 [Melastoma candidum]
MHSSSSSVSFRWDLHRRPMLLKLLKEEAVSSFPLEPQNPVGKKFFFDHAPRKKENRWNPPPSPIERPAKEDKKVLKVEEGEVGGGGKTDVVMRFSRASCNAAGGGLPQRRRPRHFQNPKLVAAEQLLRCHRVIFKSRRKKSQVYKDRLRLSPYCSIYYDQGWKRVTEDLNLKALHVSLDKITFENNKCLIKPVGLNTPPEEIDNLGLRFGMLHGSNNLANERKILKKTRLKQRKNSLTTLPDYDRRMKEL